MAIKRRKKTEVKEEPKKEAPIETALTMVRTNENGVYGWLYKKYTIQDGKILDVTTKDYPDRGTAEEAFKLEAVSTLFTGK